MRNHSTTATRRGKVCWGLVLLSTVLGTASAHATCSAWSNLDWAATTADFSAAAAQPACVLVAQSACVEFDETAPIYLDSLRVEGEFRFLDGADRVFNAHKIVVEGDPQPGGATAALSAGLPGAPFTSQLDIELGDGNVCSTAYTIAVDAAGVYSIAEAAASPTPNGFHPEKPHGGGIDTYPNRMLLALGNAEVDLHGVPLAATWSRLAPGATTPAGATSIVAALGPDFAAGDEIIVAATDFESTETERVSIVPGGVTPNPANGTVRLDLADALAHLHYAGASTQAGYPTIEERAEVAILTRNVRIYTPVAELEDRRPVLQFWSQTRANADPACTSPDVPAHGGAEIFLARLDDVSPQLRATYIEVFNAGKYGELARYPIHFHELDDASGSYVRGASVHHSANRAIVLHGSQNIALTENVAYDIVGSAFYLEHSDAFYTAQNTLVRNLGATVRNCSALDLPLAGPDLVDGAATFYFEDPRNNFIANASAGSGFAGFYSDHQSGTNNGEFDDYYLCGSTPVSFAGPAYTELDLGAIDFTRVPWGASSYQDFGFASDLDGDGQKEEVACHGSFVGNVAHAGVVGFWANQHKRTFMRLTDFTAWKNANRAVLIKNKGITELVGYAAANNKTALWLASHAFHLGSTPLQLVFNAHVVGESANNLTSAQLPVLGLEVYEGRTHVVDSHFAGFSRFVDQHAAFGTHQSLEFYSVDPQNSIENVTFGPSTRPVWFNDPSTWSSGEHSVMVYDLDGSITGAAIPSWIVPDDPFVLPAFPAVVGDCRFNLPTCESEGQGEWNAYAISQALDRYAQLAVTWCDRSVHYQGSPNDPGDDDPTLTKPCTSNDGPSGQWDQPASGGNGYYGVVLRGIKIDDVTDGDQTSAKHAPEGLHRTLSANVLAGHDYEVSLWESTTTQLNSDDLVGNFEALAVHLRYMQPNTALTVRVPVPSEPCEIHVYSGELQVQLDDDGFHPPMQKRMPGVLPTTLFQWSYEAVGTDRAVTVFLDSSQNLTDMSVSMLFDDGAGVCGSP